MNSLLKHLVISASLLLSSTVLASSPSQERALESDILNETRSFSVYLPKSYDKNSSKDYSVIYMLDAGNDDQLVAEHVEKQAREAGKQTPIVVAIKNIRRGYDFTPGYLKLGRGDNRRNGNGDKFLGFITNELIPFIDNNFATNQVRYFMGHSWGGAFASYVLSQQPTMFKGFFIFSPSFINVPNANNKEDKLSQDFISNISGSTNTKFIYLSVGAQERQRFIGAYEGFKPFLEAQLPTHIKLVTEINSDADHMANPEVSIPNALKLVFSIK